LISVRPYQPGDFHAALDVINAATTTDRTRRMAEDAFRQALSGNLGNHAVTALVDRTTTAGFVWWETHLGNSVRFEGWVHPSWRRKGVGTLLLSAVESAVRRKESLPVTLTARVYSDISGAEPLFRLRGYQEVRRFLMMCGNLSGREFKVSPPPDVVLRTFQPDDLAALVEADNTIFTGHWGSYSRSVRTWQRDMMELRPFDPSLWVIASIGDQIVGECLCHLSREFGPEDGWISIVGIRPEWRGRGLGRAVLTEGLRLLQEAGFATASLHVDAANTPAVSLYRSLGMEIARTRLHFAKTISA
jgi:mycothiol synthase